MTKQYMGDYSAKAQALIKNAARGAEEHLHLKTPVKASDFPAVPKEDIKQTADAEPAVKAEEPETLIST